MQVAKDFRSREPSDKFSERKLCSKAHSRNSKAAKLPNSANELVFKWMPLQKERFAFCRGVCPLSISLQKEVCNEKMDRLRLGYVGLLATQQLLRKSNLPTEKKKNNHHGVFLPILKRLLLIIAYCSDTV